MKRKFKVQLELDEVTMRRLMAIKDAREDTDKTLADSIRHCINMVWEAHNE